MPYSHSYTYTEGVTYAGNLKYAVYPGSVTLYDGTVKTFTAAELATLYGVSGELYLTVSGNWPAGFNELEYIHLKPRADDYYENIKTTAQDDDQVVTMGEDFDGNRQYIQETDRRYFDREYVDD